MMMSHGAHDVAHYYDAMQAFYTLFWHRAGVHYGVWDHGAHDHDSAVRRVDSLVADALALPRGSRVLDAGCGIGGTSFYLARVHGHEVQGITLSPIQLATAHKRAATVKRGPLPAFSRQDYEHTNFADESFNGVFGVESVCYGAPGDAFLAEAHRLLRPKGRLVVIDGFAGVGAWLRDTQNLRTFCDGFALRGLVDVESFERASRQAGFVDIAVRDLSLHALPSAKRMVLLSRLGSALTWLAPLAHRRPLWRSHLRAGLVQRRLLETGSLRYLLVTARRA